MKTLAHQAIEALRGFIHSLLTSGHVGQIRMTEVPVEVRMADRAAAWDAVRGAILVR